MKRAIDMPRHYYGSRGPSRARMEFLRSVNCRFHSKKNKETYSVLKGTTAISSKHKYPGMYITG